MKRNNRTFVRVLACAGLAALAAGTIHGASLNSNLVAYFPIDSATDSSTFLNDVIDDATHGVTDGTTTGSGSTSTGIAGASIIFDATRGGDVLSTVERHRYLAGTQDIDLNEGFTWSFWVNVSSSNISDTGADVVLGTRSGSGGAWHKIDLVGTSNWNNGSGSDPITYSNLADNTWHHIGYVGDTTSRRFYIDGVLVDTDFTNPSLTFNGRFEIGGSSQFNEDVTGLYDDIAIYNKALSEADIIAIANGADPTTIPSPSAALVGLIGLGGLAARRRRNAADKTND